MFKFILTTKENIEVFSFCDEFGNYFSKINKKVSKKQKREIKILIYTNMLKSYKYKIKPNEDQIVLLNKHFGSIRFAYNYFLNERKSEYETNKQTLNYNDNSAVLTKLKKLEEYSWSKEINSQSLQHSLKGLDDAYNCYNLSAQK